MSEPTQETKVAVIGAGPAGYAAAFRCADLGLKTTLIDPEANPGGVCLYRGCIPSKALLHVAEVLQTSRDAADWGLTFEPPTIDLDRLRGWKEEVVTGLTSGLGQLTRMRKVNQIRGTARFKDAHNLVVQPESGESLTLKCEFAVIATGSKPVMIPGMPEDSNRLWTSREALSLPEIPKSLRIVGGGYIGLEMGTVYAALGSEVTVVEMTSGLLPGADRSLVRPLAKRLKSAFRGVRLDTRVSGAKETNNGLEVTLEAKGKKTTETFEIVLVAVGRQPFTQGLNLDKAGVKLNDAGFVRVDEQRRTTADNVFAIGDVAGQPMLAHKGTHEGTTVAEIIAGRKLSFAPRAIPAVVFTQPEIAWCGLTESQAKEKKVAHQVLSFPWGASGRARTLGFSDGITRLIVSADSGVVLGVGIVGPNAGELISEGTLAVELGAYAEDLAHTIHPHPTLSETLMESAEQFEGLSTHTVRR